ncbi:hypothetical protein [Microcoleus sp.]|uniref:hypothetical protein n=1 Tax=Microcoleus sp. TaxID=44472 RepID=UPI003593146B
MLKKLRGKPNLEVNSHQQIALLTTNNFSTSFAPVLKLRLSLPKKKQCHTAGSWAKLTFCTILA